MNQVILIGNLTRDPEYRVTAGQNQTEICNFTLAINDGYGEKQRTEYPQIVVFGKQAGNCDRYLRKGSKVAINGRIQTRSYTNRDNQKVYVTEVVAFSVEFLTPKQEQDYGQQYQLQPQGYAQQGYYPQQPPERQPQQNYQTQQTNYTTHGYSQPPGGYQESPQPRGGYQPQTQEQAVQQVMEEVGTGFAALQDDDIPF